MIVSYSAAAADLSGEVDEETPRTPRIKNVRLCETWVSVYFMDVAYVF